MLLYSNTSSERGKTVGKGGNEFIKIELRSDKTVLPFAFITIQEKDDNTIHLSITGNSEQLKNGVFYWIPKELKSKQQNCSYCGLSKHKNPIDCRYYGSGVRGNEI